MGNGVESSDIGWAAHLIKRSKDIVVFTGAGVSAESGIETFRDDGGFWTRFPPERFATLRGVVSAFFHEPRRLCQFLSEFIRPVVMAEPNAAHCAIAELGRNKHVTVVTQNVDGLHQLAGSQHVLEIHGSLNKIVTFHGSPVRVLTRADLKRTATGLEKAVSGWFPRLRMIWALRKMIGLGLRGLHRPDAVLFGEGLREPDWSDALVAATQCDVCIVIGTSGLVLPAAAIPAEAQDVGAVVIVVDPEEPADCDVWVKGTAVEVLPKLVG